ncbi:MAG: SIMPL domain-containing protein [Bacteroidales bacterium]|nr:SIMPL domain-containing protein [Bacteroidales bacterium]
MENKGKLYLGLTIMVGLIFLGLMLPRTAREFRSFERTVSVKGLCEREVPADKVIWPVVYKVVGNDLNSVYRAIESKKEIIFNFLKKGGIEEKDISVSVPSLSDKDAQEYGGNTRLYRYVATCTITVCSAEVDKVLALMAAQSQLLSKDIILENGWEATPQFLFEGLNEIKPEMIEVATKNARQVAEKFAKDSGSSLGKIRTASQGTFSIEARDSNTPQTKKVRVVTSVTYYLKR